jgi:hypothetical protein
MHNLVDEAPARNTAKRKPMWIVLHRTKDQLPQRRTWGPDMAKLLDDLIAHDWLHWTEADGAEVHVRHRAFMPH